MSSKTRGEPHHGAATPRASCDRRADGGKTGNTPTATRSTFQITMSATSPALTATATPGGQHHDGPRVTPAAIDFSIEAVHMDVRCQRIFLLFPRFPCSVCFHQKRTFRPDTPAPSKFTSNSRRQFTRIAI